MKVSGVYVVEGKKPYLEVYINGSLHHKADYTEFRSLLSREPAQASPEEIGIGVGIPTSTLVLPAKTASLQEGLNFILTGICEPDANLTEEEELLIESDEHIFLRLPWDRKVDTTRTTVFRQIINGASPKKHEEAAKKGAKFLIIRSYAYLSGTEDVGDLRVTMQEEVHAIVDELMEKSNSPFRVGGIRIIKHATKEEFLRVEFRTVNYVHMIMHGEKNGSLCLESLDSSQNIDSLSRDEFLSQLERNGVQDVLFFFLSFCSSGGGNIAETNLSFELVKRGIAEYVLGYEGGVGNNFARDFAKDFYPSIASGKSIKESFAEASRKRPNRYVPLLYGRFLDKEIQQS